VDFKLHATRRDDRLDIGMPVDISDVLHVLAHELRGPSGIAQGYLRMLLEDRLTNPADQRRALEQTQKALARLSELTQESSRLATWFDDQRVAAPLTPVDAHALLTRAIADADLDPSPTVTMEIAPTAAAIGTLNEQHLGSALVAFLKATARELKGKSWVIAARLNGNETAEVLLGSEEQLDVLAEGPRAPNAGPITLERGGLGLSLVFAAAILDAHRAVQWTVNGARNTVGIRFPLAERPPQ
jgi:hypothetical protein